MYSSQIKCEMLAQKGLETTHATPGDLSHLMKLQTSHVDPNFPRKVLHCKCVFYLAAALTRKSPRLFEVFWRNQEPLSLPAWVFFLYCTEMDYLFLLWAYFRFFVSFLVKGLFYFTTGNHTICSQFAHQMTYFTGHVINSWISRVGLKAFWFFSVSFLFYYFYFSDFDN